MHQIITSILDFHQVMGQPIGDPRDPNVEIERDFRLALIAEEWKELQQAVNGLKKNADGVLVPFDSKAEQNAAVAGELVDLCYVVAGSAVTWGIDLGAAFEAIHEANMTKTPNGKGKAIKGEGFEPADLIGVLASSKQEFETEPGLIGDMEGAYWPTPRLQRIGSMEAELQEVKAKL